MNTMLLKNSKRFANKIANHRLKNTNLRYLAQALEEMYPNHWEFQTQNLEYVAEYENILYYYKYVGFRYCFTIHYPELVITNGKQKHTLYDLYVKLDVVDQGIPFLTNIRGARATRTIEELSSGYVHSHLPSNSGHNFANFCLGNGPIRDFFWKDVFTSVEACKYFLVILKSYLEWESKVGIPYFYMDQINSYELPSVSYSYPKQMVKNFEFYNLQFKIKPYGIEIIPDENIEQQIFAILKRVGNSGYICHKTSTGKYISNRKIASQIDLSHHEGQVVLRFKNQDVTFKLINKEDDVKYEYNAPVPELTKQVCEFLSRKLTKKQITNNRIKKEDKTEDTSENSKSNPVLVSSDT